MAGQKQLRVLVLAHQELLPPEGALTHQSKGADWKTEFDVLKALKALGYEVRILGLENDLGPVRGAIYEFQPNLVFNLMEDFHNVPIFDGNIVSYLELLKIPYTGCNPRGLMMAKDKGISKKIFHYHGIRTPDFAIFPRNQRVRVPKELKYPLIVKSLTEEASFGISQSSIVYDEQKLRERIQFVHENTITDALVESYISGRELYVGMIGNQRTEVFPIWELLFRKPTDQIERIASRRAKWSPSYRKKYGITSGLARSLSDAQRGELEATCKLAYRALGLNGYARLDFRLAQDGTPFLLEVNPNPHLGNGEDFAESASRKGLRYTDLIQKIVSLGLSWQPEGPSVWVSA